tara:strand:+ start:967 stop:1149 length:183 start_codon:yes stop_codon:yes gene_type:complete
MKKESIDTEGVKAGIDALIAEGRHNRVPWWFTPLDWVLTALFLVGIAGIIVIVKNWICGS